MADVDWPPDLPCPQPGSLRESPVDQDARDAAQVGSARRRARFTRLLVNRSFEQPLTTAQAATLRTFRDVTTKGGVAFNWRDPFTSVVYEMRFATYPEIRHLVGDRFTASIELEMI